MNRGRVKEEEEAVEEEEEEVELNLAWRIAAVVAGLILEFGFLIRIDKHRFPLRIDIVEQEVKVEE